MPDTKKSTNVTYKGTKIEPLSDNNIYSWMDDAMNLFIVEDLWQYIDPDQAPALIEAAPKDDKSITRQVAIARAVLSLLITHDTWQQFKEIKLAHQIWSQIQVKAEQLKAQKEALYLQQMETITFDSTMGMDDFINRISRKVAEIKGVNGSISDVSVSGYLIRGLPKEYDLYKPLLNSIRADVDKLKLELLKADASTKEDKLRAKTSNFNPDTTPKALAAQGNNQSNDKKPKQARDPNAYCTFHKFKGHDIKDCITYKLAQDYFNSNGKDSNSTNQEAPLASQSPVYKKAYTAQKSTISALLSSQSLDDDSTNVWYIDSGATDHFTGSKGSFITYEEIDPFPITLGDESTVLIRGKGTIILATKPELKIQLNNVLYSPQFRNTSLLSIPKITRAGGDVNFSKGKVQVIDEGTTIATGTFSPSTGLYQLDQFGSGHALKASKSEALASLETWHQRYGHLNAKYVLESINHVHGLQFKNQNPFDCDPCDMSKITRASMTELYPEKLLPGEYITIDLWGPSRVPSLSKNSYMLSTTCKGTKYRMAAYNSDRKGYFTDLQDQVTFSETQTGNKVKRLRLDNAPEFVSGQVKNWCKSKGIRLEPTTTYTPEQNGVSERSMRTIIEAERTELEQSGLPYEFWEEAAAHGIYAYNRCHLPKIGMTPYEAFYGVKPDVSNLRIFGSLAYVHIPKETASWHKHMVKAFRGIFTGYGGSGYRIWNPRKRIFVISNHCTIKEHVKGVSLLNPASQLYRRLVGTAAESDDGSTDDSDNPDTDYGDTIIVDTGNQQLDDPSENDGENHSDAESGAAENASRDAIGGASGLSEPPEPLFENNQEPVAPTGTSEQGSTNQEAPEMVSFRGKLLPRRPKSTRIAGESVDHRALLVTNQNTEASKIPSSIKEALSGPDAHLWRPSIKKELDSHLRNHTWDLVVRKHQKTIGCRWIFKIKSDGRYKSRLVAQGYTQEHGIDYFETFAPVARLSTIRIMLALAAKYGLHIQQMDVQTAFLYGELEEECYMEQPPGFIEGTNLICRLRKSIYGLKQAPRVWYQVIDRFFHSIGFQRSLSDPALYIHQEHEVNQLPLLIAIYVDDMIIIGKNMNHINSVKRELHRKFDMTDMGEIKTLLGMEIVRLRDGSVFLHQNRYLMDMLLRYQMEGCMPITTPMAEPTAPDGIDIDITEYQSRTGSLMWPSLASRPDFCFAAGYLGRSNSCPKASHSTAQKRVMRYIKGSPDMGILYDASSNEGLIGYSDADYGGDLQDRKSTSGMVFTLFGGSISWASTKQKTVATATVVAEYVALTPAIKEALWLKQLFEEISIPIGSIEVKTDAQGAMDLATNARFSQKTKHIDIRHHFIRDHINTKEIDLKHVPTREMTADILTKPLPRPAFELLRLKLGLISLTDIEPRL
jgi:hypothetical protein